jgi:hypothetical protein
VIAPKPKSKRGRPKKPKAVTVKIAVSPELHVHLLRMVRFGHGGDVADVMRVLAIKEIGRLQDAGRLPDLPLTEDV